MKRFVSILAGLVVSAHADSLDLAGEWKLALDPIDSGLRAGPETWSFPDTIKLPGTLSLAGKGDPLKLAPSLSKEVMANLHQRHSMVGPAWFQRTIEVPAAWSGMDVRLELERVLWESRVWINGTEVGSRDSLCTPHRYQVEKLIKPGPNILTIRIDNRELLPIGIGHAYTNATQTIWNGVVGRMELKAEPKVRIDGLRIRSEVGGRVNVKVSTINTTGRKERSDYRVVVTHPDGRKMPAITGRVDVTSGESDFAFAINLGKEAVAWSEFEPRLYQVEVALGGESSGSVFGESFGYRIFKAKDGRFLINGNPVFLRGTLECCIFPKTGHPDMSGDEWRKIFTTVKSHGLNHVRFHSWCPPEIAFEMADRLGVYLQVELPNWSFKMGQVPQVDTFFRAEGERIFREYGNHPSFVLFSLGNELTGDYPAMDRLVEHFRTLDPDKLFTSTSYSFSPRGKKPGPADDYFISQETESGWVRGQGFLNQTRPNTRSDYGEGLSSVRIPLVTHEVGQYNNYPNLAELPNYESGPLRALAYEAIRDDLQRKGMLDDAPRLTRDSGKLAALLYKEDMERALRTKGLGGIQLLDLHDFPGQSTATVGILDAFWDSKGLITPDAFKEFAGPTVPLARMDKMVWENTETFTADLEIAHFGKADLSDATVEWSLRQMKGEEVAKGEFRGVRIPLGNGTKLGNVIVPLKDLTEACRLEFVVSIAGSSIRNSWPVWVYPARKTEAGGDGIVVLDKPGPELLSNLAAGKRVLLLPPKAALRSPLDARFIPVFWSPLHFPNQPGTLGATIDSDHPVFASFPTETFTTWQWWEMFATSYAMDLGTLATKPAMPLRFVDKFDRNALPAALWEAKCGPGRLMVCTLDIDSNPSERIAARQLRRSILGYLASDRFDPKLVIPPDQLQSMFKTIRFNATAADSHADHPAAAAVDGDPNTFWHTDWTKQSRGFPTRLVIDLGKETVVSGVRYTPRQDMNRGRISRFRVEVGNDNVRWSSAVGERQVPDDASVRTINFEKPLKSRYLGLLILAEHGGAKNAAIAEIEPLIEDAADVRELGIIPGFND